MALPKVSFHTVILSLGGVTLAIAACSAASSNSTQSASSKSSGSNGGASASSNGGTSAGIGFAYTDASTTQGGTASRDGQVVACTNGDDCVCPTLTVAVIGTPGVWGATTGSDSDTAFQDWLNSSSAGTARVDNYTTKPTLTSDFLTSYNVIILAGLGDNSNTGPWWTFSASEVAAFQDWVENQGGGVVSLSGYAGDGNEVVPKNTLLAFSGISYNQDGVTPPCADVDANNNQMCWCAGGGVGTITDWNRTDPVIANLSLDVNMIGLANGRSINAPTDAHVAATTPNGSTVYNLLVGKITGQGRVLVYSDEWITYTSQWGGAGNPNSTTSVCQGYLPQDKFQTAQFWYNMIRWTQPNATCFKIVDQQQTVTVW